MHGTFAGSVTVALSSTTVADTRAALLPAPECPALQGFVAAGRVDDAAGGRAVHGPSSVDAGRYAQAARQLPCATMLSYASAGELAVSGTGRHAMHSGPAVLHIACHIATRPVCWRARQMRPGPGLQASNVRRMICGCTPAGFMTDVMLAAWADQQAVQGRIQTVIQWGNWTAGMPCTQLTVGCILTARASHEVPVASIASARLQSNTSRRTGSAPDFATAHQMQQTGLGALAPAAALDALAAVMLAAWHRPSHASPITAARINWTDLGQQVLDDSARESISGLSTSA